MDSYWHSRQTLADAAMEKDERALSIRVHSAYESELRRLNREIAEYYQRYGENDVLEYRRLMETMDPKDRELLIRDCDEFLRQHPDMQSIVDVRKSIYQLNRLEGLQASARLHLYQATGDVVQRIDNHIVRQSLRGANTAAEAMGFGRSFYSMDSDAVRRFVDTVWTGNTSYSQRIWDNTETLASYVAQDMSKALARGDSYQRIAKALEKRFVDVPQSSLMRLVYTEGTYVSRMAQVEELKREGFDSYTIEVVHDERACEECEGVNGSTFRFDDMQVGVNFPPLHPYCRCQIAPAVDDWDAWQQKQEELGQGQAEKTLERISGARGAVSGALYSDEVGNFDRMEQHAIRYYDAVRSRDRTEEITKVTNNSGVSRDVVEDAYQHIFYDLHLDHKNNLTRFDPDYYMAVSWQHLSNNEDIQEMDIVMLYHEATEKHLMDNGMPYVEAHCTANEKYGYNYESFVEELKKRKKGGNQ
jgi:SPP1 gp7 family putative phage head morphogenesis protein|nr:MAG TPA: minor capsid protein [Caudoviricetes sp.]